MMLANVDWNQLMTLASLAITTIGGVLTALIMLRQRGIDAKLELARIAAEAAEKEATRQGKRTNRTNRRVKQLCADTETQTALIKEVKDQTNGMTHRLVKEAEERATRAADKFEANMTASITKELEAKHTPQEVTVVNPEPIPVELKEPETPKHD